MWAASTGIIAVFAFLLFLGIVISAEQRKSKKRLLPPGMPINRVGSNDSEQDEAISRAAGQGTRSAPKIPEPESNQPRNVGQLLIARGNK